ncbi:MAG: hypothetical protein QOI95_91 [Acidimicrobiaceae bacterium]|jgi:DNA-directed RNA polymerase specialized sigma24 family protein
MPQTLVALLADDWRSLLRDPNGPALLQWCRADLDVRVDSLDHVLEHIWKANPADADELLARLTRRALVDPAAARLVLHALRPGLRVLAARLSRAHPQADPDAELLAVAWEKIRTYPISRRPRAVAANILLDTRKHYLRSLRTGHPWVNLEDLSDTSALLVAAPSAEDEAFMPEPPSIELLKRRLAAGTADGTITTATAEIIWRTRIGGEPEPKVARDLGCNVRALQRRRQRAERRLTAAS